MAELQQPDYSLAQQLGFYGAGGKAPGTTPADLFNKGVQTAGNVANVYDQIINNHLKQKQAELEMQQTQDQMKMAQTPVGNIYGVQTPDQTTQQVQSTLNNAQQAPIPTADLVSRHLDTMQKGIDTATQQAQANQAQNQQFQQQHGYAASTPFGISGAIDKARAEQAMYSYRNAQAGVANQKLTEANDTVWVDKQGNQTEIKPGAAQPDGTVEMKRAEANKFFGQSALQKIKTQQTMLDPKTVETQADLYNQTGQMPSLGMGSSPARMQILNRAAQKLSESGQDARAIVANKMAISAGQQALSAVTKNQGVIGSFGRTLDGVTNLLENAANKVGSDPLNTGVPILQRWINAGKTNVAGDVDVNNLNTLVNTAQAEYSRYMNTVTGGGNIADEATKRVQQNLEGAKTPEQIKGWVDTIRQEKQIRDQAYIDETNGIKSTLFDSQQMSMGLNQKSKQSPTLTPSNTAPIPSTQQAGKYDSYLSKFNKASEAVNGLVLEKGLTQDQAKQELKNYMMSHK